VANICSNWVEICGDPDKVLEFVEFVESIDSDEKTNLFDFNKVIPLEGSSREESSNKWGCSSIAFDVERMGYEDGDPNCEWYFWTKWNPPVEIYKKLCELFPDVYIVWRYEEPGMMLYGYLNAEDC